MFSRDDLLNHLQNTTEVFRDGRVKEAFITVDRAHFVPEEYAEEAYEDYAIHFEDIRLIKPTAAAYLLELAQLNVGNKVLVVGVQTGWLVALVTAAVDESGDVYAVEALQENIDRAEANIAPYQYDNLQIFHGENMIGLSDLGPYDRIIVTRSLPDVPDVLVDQLVANGTVVVPTEDSLVQLVKDEKGEVTTTTHPGFSFDPLATDIPEEE